MPNDRGELVSQCYGIFLDYREIHLESNKATGNARLFALRFHDAFDEKGFWAIMENVLAMLDAGYGAYKWKREEEAEWSDQIFSLKQPKGRMGLRIDGRNEGSKGFLDK